MAFKQVARLQADNAYNLHKDMPGKSLTGYYLGFKMVDGDYGPQKLHFLQGEKGNIGVWGFPDLKEQLATIAASVRPGTAVMVKVKEDGVAKKSKKGVKPKKLASVAADSDLTIDVGTIALTAESTSEPEYSDSETAEDADAAASSEDGDETDEDDSGVESAPASRGLPKGAPTTISADSQARTQAILARSRGTLGTKST